jgi:plasmid stabilization system protein ParE
MNNLDLLEIAKSEFREAIRWYHAESPESARRFALEVKSAVLAIREYPTRFHRWDKRYRFYIARGFPYYLPYRVDGDKIVVVAVFHTSRNSAAWTDR